jgi:sodium/bile acid cotransporter 7
MDRLASKGGFSQGTGFALALVLVALAGVFFPLHLGENKWLGFLAPISTFVIFLFIGRSITASGLLRVCNKPKVTMLVQGFIFAVPWAIAFVLTFIAPSSFYSIGFLIVLILPTTVSSCVVYARDAGGNAEFALGHSFIANLIAPLLFPLLSTMWIFGVGDGGIPFTKVAAEVYPRLGLLILLPVLLGWFTRKIPLLGNSPARWEAKVPQVCILFLSYLTFASGSALSLFDMPMIEWVGLAGWTMGCWLILSFFGWACGKIGGLDMSERKSTYFVVSQKSLATGIPLIFATMGTKSMEGLIWLVLPLTLYHMFQLITGAGVIAWLHARK